MNLVYQMESALSCQPNAVYYYSNPRYCQLHVVSAMKIFRLWKSHKPGSIICPLDRLVFRLYLPCCL